MTDLTLRVLEKIIASEMDVGYDENMTLIENIGNQRTGIIEFNLPKTKINLSVEEIIKHFYNGRYNITEIESTKCKNKELEILKLSALSKSNKENYIISIIKTPVHNSVYIIQEK